MSRCVITIRMPNGLVYMHSSKDYQTAHQSVDPFLWVLPGEPEGSLLYTNPDDDEEPLPTLREYDILRGRYLPDVRR